MGGGAVEMACARNIGLTDIPIVCVNAGGYYEPFKQMLKNAYEDELIKWRPEQVVHFVPTAADAVRWCEEQALTEKSGPTSIKKRDGGSLMKKSSFFDSPSIASWFEKVLSRSSSKSWEEGKLVEKKSMASWVIPFVAGVGIGAVVAMRS